MRFRFIGFTCLAVTALLSSTALAATVQITSPSQGITVSGTISLSASAQGASSVDYWMAGHSLITGQLPSNAPYNYALDTTFLWDGPTQIIAVARDAGGNIIAHSDPLNVTIQNSLTRISLQAPNVNLSLSGFVTFQVQASDPRGIQALIYSIDGKETPRPCLCGVSYTDTFQLDTTQLLNGTHYFALQVIATTSSMSYGTGLLVAQFNTNNGIQPLTLRSNFHQIHFQPGATSPVQLAPKLIYTDGSSSAVSNAFYSSDNPGIASVSSSGVVNAGAQQGMANITITGGGKTTSLRVMNVTSHAGFPHFTKDGHITYSYDSSKSLWVRTLFATNVQNMLNTPGLAGAFHQAGVNTLTTNFYANPYDYGINNFITWQLQAGALQASWLAGAKNNGFSIVGTGDDIQRTQNELNNTLNSPWAASAIQYTMNQLVQSGNVVSLEMEDEVGGIPVAQSFRSVMSVINSAPARPPLTWDVAALQGAPVFAAWEGDPTMSDYASMYWTYPGTFRPEFPWGYSMLETRSKFETEVLGKLSGLQIDKPRYLEAYTLGSSYYKRVPGNAFHPGQDQLTSEGVSYEQTTAQILGAAALGFSGVRVYAYDGSPTTVDLLWANHRANDPADSTNQTLEQTGAAPFSSSQDVRDRWQALSNAFNVIQTLEPYMLSPQMNSVDLGPEFITGARQLANGTGRVLIAINMLDNFNTASVDLSAYRFPSAGSVTRYHVAGLLSTTETVSNDTAQTLTFAPGEAVVWVFTGSAGNPPTTPTTPSTPTTPTTPSTPTTPTTPTTPAPGPSGGSMPSPGSSPSPNPSPSPSPSPVAAGTLVAEWPITDGPGVTSLADNSGNNHVLKLAGGPAWRNAPWCKFANCPFFTGSGQSASVPLDLSATKTITLTFWMNVAAYNGADGLAIEFGANPFGFNGTNGGFMVDPNSSQMSGSVFEIAVRGDAGFNQAIFSRPSAGVWHHYAIIFDKSAPGASEIVPYVDGNPIAYSKPTSATNSNTFGSDTLFLMSRNGQNLFMSGSLQDVRVYTRGLTAAEIAALAKF